MTIFSAIANWFRGQAAKPAAKPSFAATVVRIAKEQAAAGIRETSQNQGNGIQKYWSATSYGLQGYLDRQPYCAAFAAWVAREAALAVFGALDTPETPRSAAVRDWPTFARNHPKSWRILAADEPIKAGDFVCFDFNGAAPSGTHIAIAVGDEHVNGTFATAEGNTNAAGSREGDGVYRKTRTRSMILAVLRLIE